MVETTECHEQRSHINFTVFTNTWSTYVYKLLVCRLIQIWFGFSLVCNSLIFGEYFKSSALLFQILTWTILLSQNNLQLTLCHSNQFCIHEVQIFFRILHSLFSWFQLVLKLKYYIIRLAWASLVSSAGWFIGNCKVILSSTD